MSRRKAWNGNPPASAAEARRLLLDIARGCIERLGASKAGLSDVAQAAGVTRQTVYRYFSSADDLFHSAAVLASGGLHGRMRAVALQRPTFAERVVECVVFCVREIPEDPHLTALSALSDQLSVSVVMRLSFVQDELVVLSKGEAHLTPEALDALAELLLRLLLSFLTNPGERRSEEAQRALLLGWLAPAIEAQLSRPC